MKTPNFLVIGAARSGTTGLVEGLRTHPQVFVTDPKEPHYFAYHRTGAHFTAPGDEHTVNRVSVTDEADYLRLYPDDDGADYRALGDASVSTLYYHEDAIPEIKRLVPDARFVVLLREPVARAYSSHQYLRARGLEPEPDFLTAVSQEERRKAAGWHHLWHYTSMSRYYDQVEAFITAFGADRVGVWFYDDLNNNYTRTVQEILRFLQVPPADGEGQDVPRVNISGRPRSAMIHRGLKLATGNEQVRNFVKDHTSYRFRESIRRRLLARDELPLGVRQELQPRFTDDLARLRELLGDRDMPGWMAP